VNLSRRVLLVEDDPTLRTLSSRMLERLDCRVVAAATAAVARAVCQDPGHSFDLLMTDVMLPDAKGTALAAELCRLQPQMKVLFISGVSDDIALGSDRESAHFLQKPFGSKALEEKIREIFS
jgi:DNA-binding response OmpR family regulator